MPVRNFVCVELSLTSREACIRYPVGQELCVSIPSIPNADPAEIIQMIFGQINAALGPYNNILLILDAVLAIFECVKANVDAIKELNPAPLIQCIPGLVEAINRLLNMLPQVSLPLMIIDIITVLIQYLNTQIAIIERFKARIIALVNAALVAADPRNFRLKGILDCINANFDVQLQSLNEAGKPLNRIIGQVNLLMCLLGLPKIPIIGAFEGPIDPVLLVLKLFVSLLESLLSIIPSIPAPQLADKDIDSPC